MDKLRAWLNLPDGPWPPDHYALIGLKPGQGTPEEIEARVLERLELLRRYQLPHPDEATEGMNLLARALDTLTDPQARKTYDRSLGLRRVTTVELPPAPDDPLNTLFPGVPILPAQQEGPAPVEEGPILPDEFVIPDVEDEPDVDDDPEFIAEGKLELPEVPLPPMPAVARLETGPDHGPRRPMSPKRELYAELARVRRVLRIWERARPYLTDTDRTFSRRTDALALMGCLAELRPLLPTVSDLVGGPHRPGGIVAALARQRLMFDTFRTLLPGQREALAKDFRAAHYRLAGYYEDLRKEARRNNQKGWTRRVLNPTLRYLADRPEWLFLPFALLALAVALARSV